MNLIAEINKNRRILEFRFVEGTIKLYADDIIYIETELHKNVFYTEKGTFQIYKKLDELENELKDMGFVRAHLSFLVNMKYITKNQQLCDDTYDRKKDSGSQGTICTGKEGIYAV